MSLSILTQSEVIEALIPFFHDNILIVVLTAVRFLALTLTAFHDSHGRKAGFTPWIRNRWPWSCYHEFGVLAQVTILPFL